MNNREQLGITEKLVNFCYILCTLVSVKRIYRIQQNIRGGKLSRFSQILMFYH